MKKRLSPRLSLGWVLRSFDCIQIQAPARYGKPKQRCAYGSAGGHAPPVLEPAEAPFPGVARRVPFRGVGLAHAGPAGQPQRPVAPARRGRPRCHRLGPRSGRAGARRSKPQPGPGRGCCRGAGRPSSVDTEGAPIDDQLGAEAARLRPRAGSRPFRSGSDCMYRPAGRGPDIPVTPVAAIDRSSPAHTQPATGAKGHLSVPPSTALPRKDGHSLNCPRI